MKPSGGCDKVNITGGSFLMRPLLASDPARRDRLPGQHLIDRAGSAGGAVPCPPSTPDQEVGGSAPPT